MNSCYPFTNTPLPYGYDALEPFIDQKTMHLHHDRHLQAYVDSLNALLEKAPRLQGCSLPVLLRSLCRLPQSLQTPVRHSAGGVYCHRFFFAGMCPAGGEPEGALREALLQQFGSLEQFQRLFSDTAAAVFGSGYAWLVLDHGCLRILSTVNQDTPLEEGKIPLLNLDVWEHAYYLKHYNQRAAYIADWFQVVCWPVVEQRFQQATGGRRPADAGWPQADSVYCS